MTEEEKALQENLRKSVKRLERIARCLRDQVKRLGGDPDICYLEEDGEKKDEV